MNKPVAWISEYTLKNCLEGNLTDEVRATTTVTTNCTIPLYTHPVEELTPCEELRAFQEQQNGVFSEHNACCYRHECRTVWNDWEKIRSNPAELTDEEIIECAEMDFVREELAIKTPEYMWIMDFARAILRKAQEK